MPNDNLNLAINVQKIKRGLLKNMGAYESQTLFVLVLFMDEKGVASPTQEKLAEVLGINRQTVGKRIKNLLEVRFEGEPIVEREMLTIKGGIQKSLYRINPNIIKIINSNEKSSSDLFNGNRKEKSTEMVNFQTGNKVNTKEVFEYFRYKYYEKYGVNYAGNRKREMSMIKNKIIPRFNSKQIKTMIDVAFEEYDNRWKSEKYPRITLGAFVSFIGNEALTIAEERKKKEEQQKDRIAAAQEDETLTQEYYEKMLKRLGGE